MESSQHLADPAEDTSDTLDPKDWDKFRTLAHQMVDDSIDRLIGLRNMPVWRPMPDEVRSVFYSQMPGAGVGPEATYRIFSDAIAPYGSGNLHPRFMGWVQGGGTPVGMLAELLAGALNENCGGRDHVGIAVERQVIAWSAAMLGFPETAGGVLVTGSSTANFIGLLCARRRMLGANVRTGGLNGSQLVGYAQMGVHRCLAGAFDMAGLGSQALRRIPVDSDYRMNLDALDAQIEADRREGMTPFLVIGTAGSVDVGSIDNLSKLAEIAARYDLWFHVDAAFGALAALSATRRPLLAGIESADSVAFDFHKWAQVQYDAGCILVRDQNSLLDTFAQKASYLSNTVRGLSRGAPWPCDLGPDLSRSFRALKIWMTFQSYGGNRLGAIIDQTCEIATYLARQIDAAPDLSLLAPVALNIVCFRYDDGKEGLDDLNTEVVGDLQEAGSFVPSTTRIGGRIAIRAAIVNHRTTRRDVDALVKAVTAAGRRRRK